jgi:transposase
MPAQKRQRQVAGGVDTHADTHHAAAVDRLGGILGDREFPATPAGYQALLQWLRSFGRLLGVGVEGTGSYGAGLNRYLTAAKVRVVEVNRPDRTARRAKGKSDPLDAIAAARAVVSGTATGTPKTRNGPVESIRVLTVARDGAVKARTAAINQFTAILVTAPDELRTELDPLSKAAKIRACATATLDLDDLDDVPDATHATRVALYWVARRIQALDAEIKQADKHLAAAVTTTAPALTALFGVGPDSAARLLITAGDNPDRLDSESSLAHLCGVAPLPASSGKRSNRHRLNRGGDRQANKALYTITLSRLRYDQRTRDYAARRTNQGLTKREIIRCLKRYIAREIYTALLADYTALTRA